MQTMVRSCEIWSMDLALGRGKGRYIHTKKKIFCFSGPETISDGPSVSNFPSSKHASDA